jgi:hypothetical protein
MSKKRQSKKRCSLAVLHFEPLARPGRFQWEHGVSLVRKETSSYQHSLQRQWYDASWHLLGTPNETMDDAVDTVKAAVP